MIGFRTVIFCISIVLMSSAYAADDISGAADGEGIERYRGSWIVNYQHSPQTDYRLVLGGFETVNGVERPERSQILAGNLTRITYQIPDGVRTRDINRYFIDQLTDHGADILFTCKGRACGNSADWANQVFNESKLLGLVDSQYVISAKLPGQYVSMYIIERGNRRLYTHIDFIETDPAARIGAAVLTQGYAVLAVDKTPEPDLLINVTQQLIAQNKSPVLVVHHSGDSLEAAHQNATAMAKNMAAEMAKQAVSLPIESVGAWVPSVLRDFDSVVVLVIGK